MVANKKHLADYVLKPPWQGEGHHLEGAPLEVVMEKFTTLASPKCQNFVFGSKYFLRSGMSIMECAMTIKDYYGFKFVHSSRCLGQPKDNMFLFKMSVDLPCCDTNLVKRMHVGGGGGHRVLLGHV